MMVLTCEVLLHTCGMECNLSCKTMNPVQLSYDIIIDHVMGGAVLKRKGFFSLGFSS